MKQFYLLLGISLLFASCVETEPVSPIPEIGFESYELGMAYDSLFEQEVLMGVLEFSFIDGDADFGMNSSFDSLAPDSFNYNVFLTAYEKIDTNYFLVELDSNQPPLNYRINRDTPLDRVGQNKTVKGFIRIQMIYDLLPEADTLRYEFYIRDRANHRSNIETTDDIGFTEFELR